MRLLLFDIDGTLLLRATDAHRTALHAAISEVWGVAEPSAARVEAAGRTDPAIARQILLHEGIPARAIDDRMSDFRATCTAHFARLCPPSFEANVAPGIAALLQRLAARDDLLLGLLTGNLEPIAELKLARAGIARHFVHGLGGFGSDAEDRTDLPAIARRRAGLRNAPFPRRDTIVIGDTPRDIACAHADGVRAIAIATGPYRVQELAAADTVVRNAAELGKALDSLLDE